MTVKTIGLIGAGHIGSQLARLAVEHGYHVVISNSRGPDTLQDLVRELGPRARAGTPEQAADAGDIVVVTIPLKNIGDLPVEPLAGKIVIDTGNYYPQRDGHIRELDNEETTTSELLQRHLPASKIVKAFNHIYAAALTTDGQPAGTANRRALAIAGNDADAKRTVTELIAVRGHASSASSRVPATGVAAAARVRSFDTTTRRQSQPCFRLASFMRLRGPASWHWCSDRRRTASGSRGSAAAGAGVTLDLRASSPTTNGAVKRGPWWFDRLSTHID